MNNNGMKDSQTPSTPEAAQATDKKIKRPFIPLAAKDNTFYMKTGSALAGGVIVSLLVATGVMWWNDRQAKLNVPKLPPVEAIIQPVKAPDVVAAEPAIAASESVQASAPAVAVSGAASAPVVAQSETGDKLTLEPIEQTVDPKSGSIEELNKRVDAMQVQFEEVNKTIAGLQKSVNAQAIRLRAVSVASHAGTDLGTEMKVVQISPESVDVMVGVKKYTVSVGSQLPGGAKYLGFDLQKSLMRTDRGEFQIN